MNSINIYYIQGQIYGCWYKDVKILTIRDWVICAVLIHRSVSLGKSI